VTGPLALAALILALALALGLVRVLRGPATADRMMATQLVGTSGIGLLLLLGDLLEMRAALDVALVLALLAAVGVAALTREAPRDG
jgi:multicomponent Na+:H+ antiporter subunit F